MILKTLADNVKKARAEIVKEEAVSVARMIKQGRDIPDVANGMANRQDGPAKPLHAAVRMLDGLPMRFFDDGSLRHAYGRPGKAGRKALKKMRQEQRRQK